MTYSKEVVSRARAALAQKKADMESENAARLQEAYRRVPRLQQLDQQIAATMAAAARAVFAKGGDALQAMEQVKAENLALQAERDMLEKQHFAPDWLKERTVCDICGGTGYLGSAMCDCLKKLCIIEQRKELDGIFSGTESFETFSLSYYSDAPVKNLPVSERAVMERVLKICREYARNFTMESGNLLFNGGTGVGKTHLALAVGRAVGEQGYTVCYTSAMPMLTKLERARFNASAEAAAEAERFESCDLLIIDDLGTELTGQFTNAALYALINTRLMERKPMLLTTNLNIDEVEKRYSPQLASRLFGDFHRLTFVGSDIRIQKTK